MMIGLLTSHFWTGTVLNLNEAFWPTFTIMLFSIPAGSLMSYFSILTRYKKKTIHFSIGTLIQLIIQIGISVVGVVILRAGIISVFYGVLAGEIFAIFYFSLLNKEYISMQFDKALLKRALIFALPTLPAILAGWLDSSMGQILIGKYVSVEDLGVYSIALSLASVFTLISTAFQNVWSPFLYENYNKQGFTKSIQNLFAVIVIVLILISLLLSLFSREIVLLFSNEGYLDACGYLTLLCIPMSFYLMFPFASSGVLISRDTKYVGISYVSGSLGNILLLFILIKSIGVIAVPLCLAVSRLVTYYIMYFVSKTKMGYQLPNIYLIVLILVVIVCYFVSLLHIPLMARIGTALVGVFFAGLYVWRSFNLKLLLDSVKVRKNNY